MNKILPKQILGDDVKWPGQYFGSSPENVKGYAINFSGSFYYSWKKFERTRKSVFQSQFHWRLHCLIWRSLVMQDKEKNNRLRLDRIRSYWPRDNPLIYNLNESSFLLEYTYKRTSLFWFQSKVIAVALMRQSVGTNATGGNFEL